MEAEGRKFFTSGEDRQEMECMKLLHDYCGVNSIRLRVWVNPADGWNNIDDVVLKAQKGRKPWTSDNDRFSFFRHLGRPWASGNAHRLAESVSRQS